MNEIEKTIKLKYNKDGEVYFEWTDSDRTFPNYKVKEDIFGDLIEEVVKSSKEYLKSLDSCKETSLKHEIELSNLIRKELKNSLKISEVINSLETTPKFRLMVKDFDIFLLNLKSKNHDLVKLFQSIYKMLPAAIIQIKAQMKEEGINPRF